MAKNTANPTGGIAKISVPDASDQREDTRAPALGGDSGIRIAREGTWFHNNSPIDRKALVRLFSTVLRREADGDYWLVTPVERGQVQVEDAPFVAVELSVIGAGPAQKLRFRTNVDDWVEAGADHPIRVAVAADTGEPRPYILVRAGLEALILRSVYYRMAALAVARAGAEDTVLGVWSNKEFFPLECPD